MKKEDILNKLSSTKSADRRGASKEIGKQKLTEFGDFIFDAYCKEKKDSRTWETKVEMILAMGIINYKPALAEIEIITDKNIPHDMITYAAAQTYVRLKRESLSDAQPVVLLLKGGGLSLVSGVLYVLGHDRMMPPETQISTLLKLGWDLHKHKDRVGYEYGYLDPRHGLALACAGWDKKLTTAFLNYCLETSAKDGILKKIAEKALKGKYA